MGLELTMILDYENKTLQIKIVYYGPAMSGKTTSVKYLFSYFKKEDTLKSIDSTLGRTLFFDFGVLQFSGTIWDLKLLIYSATGQDFYASTRPATLNGVSGIIFVVDSQIEYLNHNIRSWNELKALFRDTLFEMPIVISLNKYDLECIKKINESEFLNQINYEKYKKLFIRRTSAKKGIGIMEVFDQILRFILPDVNIQLTT